VELDDVGITLMVDGTEDQDGPAKRRTFRVEYAQRSEADRTPSPKTFRVVRPQGNGLFAVGAVIASWASSGCRSVPGQQVPFAALVRVAA
jgi:hypothetical protein